MRIRSFIPLIVVVAGCASELETGYKPRPLTSTDAQRRGYYADPFTPESRAAEAERRQQHEVRRPSHRF